MNISSLLCIFSCLEVLDTLAVIFKYVGQYSTSLRNVPSCTPSEQVHYFFVRVLSLACSMPLSLIAMLWLFCFMYLFSLLDCELLERRVYATSSRSFQYPQQLAQSLIHQILSHAFRIEIYSFFLSYIFVRFRDEALMYTGDLISF